KKSIVDALAQEGVGLRADKPIGTLQRLIEPLLTRAKAAGLVRADAELPEVMGVLTGTCQAALGAGWDEDLQARVLDIVFTGLRPR
ncbi:MAG TPA: TetR/AcrR family transcriptional regulator, partial [Microlunatus sp.]|nr:TetR/AcrR family transcriptional regulator [Microlunatus sp.]